MSASQGASHGGGGEPARAAILRRAREALEGRAALPHPGPLPAGPVAHGRDAGLLARLGESLLRSGGELVLLQDEGAARAWIGDMARGLSGAAVGPDVPPSLRPPLPSVDPRKADLGVSLAVAAAADTGSVLLSSREGRGLQLLPPVHVVWVEPARVRPTLEEALDLVRGFAPLPATLALHSGPSKSADIGRILVTGVHGPGRLVAAVIPFPRETPESRPS